MAVGDSTALESAADEEATPGGVDAMFEDNDDVLIPEDMKRFLNEQYQHTVGQGPRGQYCGAGAQRSVLWGRGPEVSTVGQGPRGQYRGAGAQRSVPWGRGPEVSTVGQGPRGQFSAVEDLD